MKWFALMILVLVMAACRQTPQQKAEMMVKKYLDTSLSDPKSYGGINFGPLTKFENGELEIRHTYRAKNEFGAIVKKTAWFIMDTTFIKVAYTDINLDEFNEIKADSAKLDSAINKLLHRS